MRQGFALFAGTASAIIRTSAQEAEMLGYRSFWVNNPPETDGLAALALAAQQTRRIELGIGVIPLHTHGPDRVVQGVRDNALPEDRLLLGVGSPKPGALSRVRSGVAELRSQLPSRLVVGALGPQMCRVAGEVADGVLFNWLTPEHARLSAEWVRTSAAVAGRLPPKLFAYVRVAIGSAACEKLQAESAQYAAIPWYADHFTRMGVEPAETAIAVQSPDAVLPALDSWRGAVDEIVIRAITGKDTVEDNLAVLRAAARV